MGSRDSLSPVTGSRTHHGGQGGQVGTRKAQIDFGDNARRETRNSQGIVSQGLSGNWAPVNQRSAGTITSRPSPFGAGYSKKIGSRESGARCVIAPRFRRGFCPPTHPGGVVGAPPAGRSRFLSLGGPLPGSLRGVRAPPGASAIARSFPGRSDPACTLRPRRDRAMTAVIAVIAVIAGIVLLGPSGLPARWPRGPCLP
jgi:hypothetical protein